MRYAPSFSIVILATAPQVAERKGNTVKKSVNLLSAGVKTESGR